MDPKVSEVIDDLKSYLEYLKGMGIEALPFPLPIKIDPEGGSSRTGRLQTL